MHSALMGRFWLDASTGSCKNSRCALLLSCTRAVACVSELTQASVSRTNVDSSLAKRGMGGSVAAWLEFWKGLGGTVCGVRRILTIASDDSESIDRFFLSRRLWAVGAQRTPHCCELDEASR